jgi:hypothetical protein
MKENQKSSFLKLSKTKVGILFDSAYTVVRRNNNRVNDLKASVMLRRAFAPSLDLL